MLILVNSPLAFDYSNFLAECIEKISNGDTDVKVIVRDHIVHSSHLNHVLSTLYTQVRTLLAAKDFGAEIQVDVHFNLPSWRLRAWEAPILYLEASEAVPHELSGARLYKISQPPIPRSFTSSREPNFEEEEDSYEQFSFSNVAVGGTFDHLHDGHKILLSIAAFVTKTRLIVGVTGPELLKNKKYASMLQTLEYRIKVVCDYLGQMLQDHQCYVIYQINDVCGPTGYIADINALVISEETLQGAKYVNEYRQKVDMPELAVIAAKVLGGDGNADNNWQGKLSSTDMRKAEYESQLSKGEKQ